MLEHIGNTRHVIQSGVPSPRFLAEPRNDGYANVTPRCTPKAYLQHLRPIERPLRSLSNIGTPYRYPLDPSTLLRMSGYLSRPRCKGEIVPRRNKYRVMQKFHHRVTLALTPRRIYDSHRGRGRGDWTSPAPPFVQCAIASSRGGNRSRIGTDIRGGRFRRGYRSPREGLFL